MSKQPCKHREECDHYEPSNPTCNKDLEASGYCGKYKKFKSDKK